MKIRLKLSQLLMWSWGAWPLFLTIGVCVIHYLAYRIFGHPQFLNKLMAAFLQVIGVLCLLGAINQNLGTFRNHGLVALFLGYLRAFPLWSKPTAMAMSGTITGSATLEAAGRVKRRCVKVEEHIEELYKAIEYCIDLIHTKDRVQIQRLESVRTEMRNTVSGVETRLNKLSLQVEETVVGGIDLQVCGVLLLLYGAILSIFT